MVTFIRRSVETCFTSYSANSDPQSEDSDSEISVSKLQSIKSIAAERRNRSKKEVVSSVPPRGGSTNGHVKLPVVPHERNSRQSRSSSSSTTYNPQKYRGESSITDASNSFFRF